MLHTDIVIEIEVMIEELTSEYIHEQHRNCILHFDLFL